MKNTIRLLGIIALVAVIGFSFASCDSGGGGSGNNSLRITNISYAQAMAGQMVAAYGVFPANVGIDVVRADIIAIMDGDFNHNFQIIAGNMDDGDSDISMSGTSESSTAAVPLWSAESAFDNRWSGTHTDVHVWIVLVGFDGNYVVYQTDSIQAFTGGRLTLHAQNDFSQVDSGSIW